MDRLFFRRLAVEKGRSGAGEWREFDEVGTDGAPPRTPVVAGEPRAGAAISMGTWLSIGEAILV